MSFARTAFCVLVVVGGLVDSSGARAPRAALAASARSSSRLRFAQPSQPTRHGDRALDSSGRDHRIRATVAHVRARSGAAGDPSFALLERVGIKIAAGVLVLCALMLVLVARRVWRRGRREYALYELHLSTHDQAKGQDLEDMVESIANIVRAWPAERIRNGQPYLALELICGVAPANGGPLEMEWSINIRCEPKSATALDGAISATYPDVRLGRIHGEQPLPAPGVLREPGYVMRFRKERSFVYSLIADGEEQASAPLEQIARAQVAVAAPTVVRFQLTPTPVRFEALARRLYRRHENKLVRQEHWGLPEGGLTSTFNRAEMRAAERTQNRSLFWLEAVVAADTPEACKTVAAAVQSRRGENRLHRRWMTVRQRLYRRRFPRALGPLIPSWRSLVSAAEVAHLLELPSARMKGVPVRRVSAPADPRPARSRPWPPGARTCRPAGRRERTPARLSPAHHPTLKGDPHMSQDDYPGRDATPHIPHLPAPPTIMRGRRPRPVPSSGTLQAAARARAQLPAGSASLGVRAAQDTSRRP